MRPFVGVLVQPFWGQLADRTGSRGGVLAGITLGTALAYALFPLAEGFVPLLLAMAGVALFSAAIIPTSTSLTLAALGPDAACFGRVRVW